MSYRATWRSLAQRAQHGATVRSGAASPAPHFDINDKNKKTHMKVKNKKYPQWRDKHGMRAMTTEARMRGDATLIRSG